MGLYASADYTLGEVEAASREFLQESLGSVKVAGRKLRRTDSMRSRMFASA